MRPSTIKKPTPISAPKAPRKIQIDMGDSGVVDMDWDSPDPPTKQDVLSWVQRTKPPAPPPTSISAAPSPSSSGVWGRIKRTASDLASETASDWQNRGALASGFMEGAKEGARTEVPKLAKKVGSNLLGIGEQLITPVAKQAQDFGVQMALGNMGPKEALGQVTGVNPGGSPGEIGGDLITALLLHKAMGGRATEPTPKPRIVPGEASTLIPNRRALPPVSSPTIIPSSADAFHAGPPGTGVEAFGGPKLGTVEGFAPQPVSAGMGRTPAAQMSPATRAFEALVPERYKGDVTPRNLTTVGPPEPVNPYLSIVTDKGVERGIRARGIRLAQEKAAAPPPDVPVKATKKAPAPPKKVAVKVEPKTATAGEALKGAQAGEVRMFEKSPLETLQALVKRGNKQAAREIELRAAGEVQKKPVGKGGIARLKSETGATGPQIEQATIGSEKSKLGQVGDLFSRFVTEDTGAVPLSQVKAAAGKVYKGGKTALKAANELRIEAMLSGWALPKSLAGNIGAHGTAAIENLASGKGLKAAAAPIKEFFNVRENLKNIKKGYKNNPNPAGIQSSDVLPKWMRPFSATMGAFDAAATESLMRSGKTLKEAQRLLLTDPQHDITKIRGNPVIDYLAPFKRTPGNQFFGGATTMGKHPFLAAGAAAGGALAGTQTDDPRALALISSLGGPYALPILAGAAATAGPRALQGISPIPEWSIQKSLGDPANPFQRPAITRMFAKPGEREEKRPSRRSNVTKRPARR